MFTFRMELSNVVSTLFADLVINSTKKNAQCGFTMKTSATRANIISEKLNFFEKNETFENARAVFLVCRIHHHAIPEKILEYITIRFEKDHAECETSLRINLDELSVALHEEQLQHCTALNKYVKAIKRSSPNCMLPDTDALNRAFDTYWHEPE